MARPRPAHKVKCREVRARLFYNSGADRFEFFLHLAKSHRDVDPGKNPEVFDEQFKAAFGKGELPDRVDALDGLPPKTCLLFDKTDADELIDMFLGICVSSCRSVKRSR